MTPAAPAPWVLVTGGAGYVAGAVVRALQARGLSVTVLDDLSSGHADAVPPEVHLVVGTVGDGPLVAQLTEAPGLLAIFHFAGLTQVADSMRRPEAYYRVNVGQGLTLVERAARLRVPFIFSSSAAVYGIPERTPLTEDAPLAPINPYGETKRVMEQALRWAGEAHGLPWVALRYFNAAGAVPGVWERHRPETHLIPNLLAAARGGPPASLFGTDYPTPDGTAVRDYVHLKDLAEGHLLALDHLRRGGASGAFNLGGGQGASVRQVLQAVEAAIGRRVPHRFTDRRPGDPPVLVADIGRARAVLGFTPRHSHLSEMVADAWRELERAEGAAPG